MVFFKTNATLSHIVLINVDTKLFTSIMVKHLNMFITQYISPNRVHAGQKRSITSFIRRTLNVIHELNRAEKSLLMPKDFC